MRQFITCFCLIYILAACNSFNQPSTPSRIINPPTLVPNTPTPMTDEISPSETPETSPSQPLIQDCPDAPRIILVLQEQARVTDNNDTLNLRRGPGTNYDIVTRMNPGDFFVVLDGPACAGDYTWFEVRYRDFETGLFYQGWIAEGDFDRYYVEPYLPG